MARGDRSERTEDQGQPLRWSLGATGVAIILWGIISLSDTYVWDIEVPLQVRIDSASEALADQIPKTITLSVQGDGWTLMQMVLDGDLRCDIDVRERTASQREDSLRTYRFTQRDLTARINAPRSVQISNTEPETLTLAVTDLARKRVPLVYDQSFKINTRPGFQIIGRPSVFPDSVTLSGSPEELEKISFWRTKPLPLNDLYGPIQEKVPVDDTLHGVVTVLPEVATVGINVQESAELVLENLRVVNRGTRSDTAVELRLYPSQLTVILRGGAGELGRLTEASVTPTVNLTYGIDTSGYVIPRVTLPSTSNATVISITPDRVRYVWRRRAEPGG